MGEKDKETLSSVEAAYIVDGGREIEVGGEDSEVRNTDLHNASLEFDSSDSAKDEQGEQGSEGSEGKQEKGEEKPETKPEDTQDGDDEETVEDLGEFKVEEQEKWDKAYTKEGGLLNVDRLSAEWWSNHKDEGGSGKLNEGTYKFLEKKGFSRADVDAIGAALEAQAGTIQSGLEERAGGKEALDAALQWGRSGGYSTSQMERFNKAMKSNDLEAMQEAIDLLRVRYEKANPQDKSKAEAPQRTKPKETRGAVVPRAQEDNVEKYKSMEEQIEARRALNKIKDPVARRQAWTKHIARMRG